MKRKKMEKNFRFVFFSKRKKIFIKKKKIFIKKAKKNLIQKSLIKRKYVIFDENSKANDENDDFERNFVFKKKKKTRLSKKNKFCEKIQKSRKTFKKMSETIKHRTK